MVDDAEEDNVPLIAFVEPAVERVSDDSSDVLQQLIDIADESIAATNGRIDEIGNHLISF